MLRRRFDSFYDRIKPVVFRRTAEDPELAHEMFISFCKFLYLSGLEGAVLNNTTNKLKPGLEISNAAGFNKNAEIPPSVLRYLGFDRVVIGTVTHDAWEGNPRPRIRRYIDSGSIVNWMGLPGTGANIVATRLDEYDDHGTPLTINLMATPGKEGSAILRDLEDTVYTLRDLPYINRWELNISCPNTHSKEGSLDARSEYQEKLDEMIHAVHKAMNQDQQLYIKVSPDLCMYDIGLIVEAAKRFRVEGITCTNTTTEHDQRYIEDSPGKGGASGNAVYERSLAVQRTFFDMTRWSDMRLIACGGINSVQRAEERKRYGASGIQFMTPFIYEGPKLLREFRTRL